MRLETIGSLGVWVLWSLSSEGETWNNMLLKFAKSAAYYLGRARSHQCDSAYRRISKPSEGKSSQFLETKVVLLVRIVSRTQRDIETLSDLELTAPDFPSSNVFHTMQPDLWNIVIFKGIFGPKNQT